MKPKKKLYQQESRKIAIFRAVFEGVPGVHSRVKYPYLVDLDVIYKISTINSRVDVGNTFKNGPQNRPFFAKILSTKKKTCRIRAEISPECYLDPN